MTIDAHCHLYVRGFMPDNYWEQLSRFIAEDMGKIAGKPMTPGEVEETLFPKWWDPTGEVTIGRMDEAGIEKSVLLPEDVGLLVGEGEISIEEQHRQIAQIAQRYPDRFFYFCQVDPRRPEALGLLERSVKEWGARGLKFYPTSGFNPDDRMCDPFLERLSQWGMPLIVHTGASYGYAEGSHPARLERILRDFPCLTVLACHLGLNWWRELIALGKDKPNLLTDFSGFQPTLVGTYGRFCHILRRFLDEFGAERVLFGTDAPAFEHVLTTREWVQAIKDLPFKSPQGISFTEEEIAALLHGNAARLFGSK